MISRMVLDHRQGVLGDLAAKDFPRFIEDGLDFPDMSVRIAQMLTLWGSLGIEEDAFMAVTYRGRVFPVVVDKQLYDLADRIYEDYLPAEEKVGARKV